ncbi:MAG: hypothetical protein JXA46_15765 [Dehalococcoidales bacterium]|nr:hypothetical protein [Dehalococcoidales bacterium]
MLPPPPPPPLPPLEVVLYITAYNAWQQNLDIRQTRNYAGRRIRAFFRKYGYKEYRNTYARQEFPLSVILADWQEEFLNKEGIKVEPFFRTNETTDMYMEKRILNALERSNTGMPQVAIANMLEVPTREARHYLDKLVKANKVIKVERESWCGSAATPLYYLIGGSIPVQKKVRTEIYARIRQAYFVEGKKKYQIAEEFHHDYNTVCKAIDLSGTPIRRPPDPAKIKLFENIRYLYYMDHKPIRQIARELGCGIRTVGLAIHSSTAVENSSKKELAPV